MNKILSVVLILSSIISFARNNFSQNDVSGHYVGVTIGPSWALTDLGGGGGSSSPFLRDINLKATKFGIGAFYKYTVNEWVAIRGQLFYGMLGGSDQYSRGLKTYTTESQMKGSYYRKARNLDFKTHLFQIEAMAELNLKRYDPSASGKGSKSRWAPYIAGGFGMFFFNPYTNTFSTQNLNLAKYPAQLGGGNIFPSNDISELRQYEGTKINLRKLGGATGSVYAPVSFNLTGIIGIKFNVTDKISLFGELWYNKTFTDNLDDVNGPYAALATYKTMTPLQKAMIVRYYEIQPTLDPTGYYSSHSIWDKNGKGQERGDDNVNDAKGTNDQFFSAQIGISIRLEGGNRNNGFGCGRKNPYNHKFSCPKW